MFAAALCSLWRVALNAKAKADQFDEGGLAGAPCPDNNVQARPRPNVKTVEEPLLNLNPLNYHIAPIDQVLSQVDDSQSDVLADCSHLNFALMFKPNEIPPHRKREMHRLPLLHKRTTVGRNSCRCAIGPAFGELRAGQATAGCPLLIRLAVRWIASKRQESPIASQDP